MFLLKCLNILFTLRSLNDTSIHSIAKLLINFSVPYSKAGLLFAQLNCLRVLSTICLGDARYEVIHYVGILKVTSHKYSSSGQDDFSCL